MSDPHGVWVLDRTHSDEFDGRALDTRKWNNDLADWGGWSWKPTNVLVRDGHLHLTMRYRTPIDKNSRPSYTSGIIKTKASPILYGYFEARIQASQRFPGVAPAFWAYHTSDNIWTEIDFVELTEHRRSIRWIDTNTHIFKHPELPPDEQLHERRTWYAPWNPSLAFHVYGCSWDHRTIEWYIDGLLVKSRKNVYWHQALDVTISMGVRAPLNTAPSPKGFPATMTVDYVRVWHSLEATIDGHKDTLRRETPR